MPSLPTHVSSLPGIVAIGAILGLGPSAPGPAQADPPVSVPRVIAEYPIPESLPGALDLRAVAGGGRAIYLSDARGGTFRFDLGAGGRAAGGGTAENALRVVVPGAGDPDGFWYHALLGASKDYLAVSATFGGLTWKALPAGALAPQQPFSAVVDIDLHGDRLAVLGARRGDDGTWAPDGAMAWIGSLSRGLNDLRPVLYSQGGEGAPAMADCHHLYLGVVRFLPDGRLLIVPGVEGGARLLSREGKVLRTWESAQLGIADGCGAAGRKEEYARLWRARYSGWLNRNRILDDVLPLPRGPALLVRRVEGERTRWDLRLLDPDSGESRVLPLPVVAESPNAHLRGDVLEGRLVVMLRETHDIGARPTISRKIFEIEVPP